jgi:hypothetical protein
VLDATIVEVGAQVEKAAVGVGDRPGDEGLVDFEFVDGKVLR